MIFYCVFVNFIVLFNCFKLLKYYSLINVRSTRGRNSKGNKITGIEVLHNDENKVRIKLKSILY